MCVTKTSWSSSFRKSCHLKGCSMFHELFDLKLEFIRLLDFGIARSLKLSNRGSANVSAIHIDNLKKSLWKEWQATEREIWSNKQPLNECQMHAHPLSAGSLRMTSDYAWVRLMLFTKKIASSSFRRRLSLLSRELRTTRYGIYNWAKREFIPNLQELSQNHRWVASSNAVHWHNFEIILKFKIWMHLNFSISSYYNDHHGFLKFWFFFAIYEVLWWFPNWP